MASARSSGINMADASMMIFDAPFNPGGKRKGKLIDGLLVLHPSRVRLRATQGLSFNKGYVRLELS